MNLILASTSPYRKQLLSRLQIPFATVAPGTDESPLPDEPANALVERLALAKALAKTLAKAPVKLPAAPVAGNRPRPSLDFRSIYPHLGLRADRFAS